MTEAVDPLPLVSYETPTRGGFELAWNQETLGHDDDFADKLFEEQIIPLSSAQADLVAAHANIPNAVITEARRIGLVPASHADDFTGYLTIQLCRVAQRYDPEMGARFSTYAFKCLRYAVIDAIREQGVLDGQPRSAIEKFKKAVKAAGGESTREGLEIRQASFGATVFSLDKIKEVKDELTGIALSDMIPDKSPTPETVVESNDSIRDIYARIDFLPDREWEIVREYLEGATLKEIGERRNLTESRMSQVFSIAREHLRHELGLPDPRYDDQTLADSTLGQLLQTKRGTFSARPNADVIRRLSNKTGAGDTQIVRVLERLEDEGYIYIHTESRARATVQKIGLTLRGRALSLVHNAPPSALATVEHDEQKTAEKSMPQQNRSVEDILATLSGQLALEGHLREGA